MPQFLKDILDNIWMRVFAPLVLVGCTGLSTNLLASAILQDGASLKVFLQNPWTYVYIVSAVLFGIYEYTRAQGQLDQAPIYYNAIMNDIKPNLIQHCKKLIDKGQIDEAVKSINNTKAVFKQKK